MTNAKKILIINPGSTSTKIGLYDTDRMVINESVKHSAKELRDFKTIWDQYDYRKNAILGFMHEHQISLSEIDAIACRGGNVRPIPGGIYRLCPAMIKDMKSGIYGKHPTNVGGLVAYDLGNEVDIPVFTLDPPMTDERCASARYSGIPQLERLSSFHALNQKATARKVAAEIGRSYDQLNMIVVHMGGGISVGAHRRCKIIENAVELALKLGYGKPRVAVLSSVEVVNPLHKALTFYANRKIAAAVMGPAAPVVMLSRADSIETKLRAIALSTYDYCVSSTN